MAPRIVRVSCFALVTLTCGCAKKTPPTLRFEMEPEVVRILLDREPETAPTEPAPGGRDLMIDTERDDQSALVGTVVAMASGEKSPPWHCYDARSQGIEVGGCEHTVDGCRRWRAETKKAGAHVSACREQPRAACFWSELPLKDLAGFVCYSSFEACENLRALFAEDVEHRNVGECEARRLAET